MYNSIRHGANFFCYRKFKGSNSPPLPILLFNKIWGVYNTVSIAAIMLWTIHIHPIGGGGVWYRVFYKLLSICWKYSIFKSDILLTYFWKQTSLKVRTLSFLFSLLEILAATFENTLSKKTSIEKRGKNVILRKLRNVNHELCKKARIAKCNSPLNNFGHPTHAL